ncbi:D-alanyl-D-alanine carboxypeptidase DacB [Portibacter lacus]|uniref:D-alanyl-D-alanine carboxypeptidase DacB n=2 Tax=Portibacter lacus TaxID=1099794 RepID=A0AA37SNH1_9BACT|nr:D-alanyl-D-alanine carboxypeptidase DacB [Portibacter lacus]
MVSACKTTHKLNDKNNYINKIEQIISNDSIFRNSHTGLLVRDISTNEDIIKIKTDQYFTPASNTKLLTFYTSLNILDDRINGLKVFESADSLIIWGTGDPTFMNHYLKENDFITERLRATKKPIYLSTSNFHDKHFGSGWSWDDYNYGYQADKSGLPMYGNLVNFRKKLRTSNLEVVPAYFEKLLVPNVEAQRSTFIREEQQNIFNYDYNKLNKIGNVNRYVPFLTSDQLVVELLRDLIGKEVTLIDQQKHIGEAEKIKTAQVDSLYELLLHPSDNFVAEQLLLNCSSELFDTMNTRKIIDWSKEHLLSEMPHPFQWVDGSGLSRYNMTTPGNMVHLLELIYEKVDQERLFRLLPTGGETGTIRNLYAAEKPFIHAKTGSLSNNHSLSGFLIGDSGKVYVFSLMNSNYLVSTRELKGGMDRVLRILKANL